MFTRVRRATKSALQGALGFRAQGFQDADLTQDAWVVAPHPDDETLGCGGTIAEKSQRGARVHVAFVSDGSESHARWMDRAELSRRRKAEGYQACARLGVREEDVHFLDLPDGNLTDRRKEGAAALTELFARNPLGQFFIPHRLEPPPDHAAVTAMATDAVRKARLEGDLFEYPVWMWARWPWVPRREDRRSRGRTKARQAAILGAGVREVITELRWRADVRSRIAAKREALACHETQTVRLLEATEWPVLGDIADGEFLECFFSGWEYFRRSRIPG